MKWLFCSLAVSLAWAAGSTSALAQIGAAGGPGSVSGVGSVDIKRLPEAMRMKVIVTAKADNLQKALAALKDKTEAASAQLATLGADKASVSVQEPQLAAERTDRQRQMQMMMMQRMRSGKRAPKKEETKTPVSVSATISAQWPLSAKSGEELLIAASTLQDKIKAADLAGAKETAQLSPEEQEALAELESSGFNPYGEEEAKPGEPTFIFVSAISDAEREKAEGEAFRKAKDSANRLAKAAGAGLGKLQSLGGDSQPGVDADETANAYGGYDPRAYRMMQMMRGGAAESTSEAIGPTPGKVTYRVTITASFQLVAP